MARQKAWVKYKVFQGAKDRGGLGLIIWNCMLHWKYGIGTNPIYTWKHVCSS